MDRRGFLTSAAAFIATPGLVRASSLEYVPRLSPLIWNNRRILVSETIDLSKYGRVIIRNCVFEQAPGFYGPLLRTEECRNVEIVDTVFHQLNQRDCISWTLTGLKMENSGGIIGAKK